MFDLGDISKNKYHEILNTPIECNENINTDTSYEKEAIFEKIMIMRQLKQSIDHHGIAKKHGKGQGRIKRHDMRKEISH